jgi:hypothetical protein
MSYTVRRVTPSELMAFVRAHDCEARAHVAEGAACFARDIGFHEICEDQERVGQAGRPVAHAFADPPLPSAICTPLEVAAAEEEAFQVTHVTLPPGVRYEGPVTLETTRGIVELVPSADNAACFVLPESFSGRRLPGEGRCRLSGSLPIHAAALQERLVDRHAELFDLHLRPYGNAVCPSFASVVIYPTTSDPRPASFGFRIELHNDELQHPDGPILRSTTLWSCVDDNDALVLRSSVELASANKPRPGVLSPPGWRTSGARQYLAATTFARKVADACETHLTGNPHWKPSLEARAAGNPHWRVPVLVVAGPAELRELVMEELSPALRAVVFDDVRTWTTVEDVTHRVRKALNRTHSPFLSPKELLGIYLGKRTPDASVPEPRRILLGVLISRRDTEPSSEASPSDLLPLSPPWGFISGAPTRDPELLSRRLQAVSYLVLQLAKQVKALQPS